KKDSGTTFNFYGFDDNQDGNLDRIEIRGFVRTPRPITAIAFHRTITQEDSDFSSYNDRMNH
ncbi:MAG: hypothetical protein AABX03_00850, partial [Nanoarchaeota archaeon]